MTTGSTRGRREKRGRGRERERERERERGRKAEEEGLAWAPLLSVKYYGEETGQITSQPFRKALDTFSYCTHTEMCSIEFGFSDVKAMNLGLRSQTV